MPPSRIQSPPSGPPPIVHPHASPTSPPGGTGSRRSKPHQASSQGDWAARLGFAVGSALRSTAKHSLQAAVALPFESTRHIMQTGPVIGLRAASLRPNAPPLDIVPRAGWLTSRTLFAGVGLRVARALAASVSLQVVKPMVMSVGKSLTSRGGSGRALTILAGCVSGVVSLPLVMPFDVVRTAQAIAEVPTLSVANSAALQAIREAGFNDWRVFVSAWQLVGPWRLMTTGIAASAMGVVIYRSLYIIFYDGVVAVLGEERRRRWAVTVAVTTALVAGFLTYPLDTVRRAQVALVFCGDVRGQSLRATTAALYQAEGIAAFFNGVLSNISRGLLSSLLLACM